MGSKGYPSHMMPSAGYPQERELQRSPVFNMAQASNSLRFLLTQTAFYHICHKKATIAFNMFSNFLALLLGACLITAGGIGLSTLGKNSQSGLKVAIGVISLVGTFFLVVQRQFVPAVTGKLHEIAAREYLSLFENVHDLKLNVDCGEMITGEQTSSLTYKFEEVQGHSPSTGIFESRVSKPFWMNIVFYCCGLSQVEGPGNANITELADYLTAASEAQMNYGGMPMFAQPQQSRGYGPGPATPGLSKIKSRRAEEGENYPEDAEAPAPARPKPRPAGDDDVRKSYASQPQTSPRPKSQRLPSGSTPGLPNI